ncbi:MAG: hypothetical protein ACKO5K_13310 [Armatimonadota bacterium]
MIERELAQLEEEIGTLEARRGHTLARPLDPAPADLQARLQAIERRIVAIEPIALEHTQLVSEADQLRVRIAAHARMQDDLDRTGRRIDSLRRRRDIISHLVGRVDFPEG